MCEIYRSDQLRVDCVFGLKQKTSRMPRAKCAPFRSIFEVFFCSLLNHSFAWIVAQRPNQAQISWVRVPSFHTFPGGHHVPFEKISSCNFNACPFDFSINSSHRRCQVSTGFPRFHTAEAGPRLDPFAPTEPDHMPDPSALRP